jgi:hypothetical protein
MNAPTSAAWRSIPGAMSSTAESALRIAARFSPRLSTRDASP